MSRFFVPAKIKKVANSKSVEKATPTRELNGRLTFSWSRTGRVLFILFECLGLEKQIDQNRSKLTRRDLQPHFLNLFWAARRTLKNIRAQEEFQIDLSCICFSTINSVGPRWMIINECRIEFQPSFTTKLDVNKMQFKFRL